MPPRAVFLTPTDVLRVQVRATETIGDFLADLIGVGPKQVGKCLFNLRAAYITDEDKELQEE